MQKIKSSLQIWILLIISLFTFLSISGCLKDKKNLKSPKDLVFFVWKEQESFQIKPVERAFSAESNKIKASILELLKGPTPKEQKNNYRSEIPAETKLLSFLETPQKIEINLSKEFRLGGGTRSMDVRFKQISETVNQFNQQKDIYLLIEGRELLVLGGEGLEVQNPISVAKTKTQTKNREL